MYPQADGKVLEKGSMVNPATGKETAYEEVWHDIEPTGTKSDKVKAFVLQVDSETVRGSIVRYGQYCQAFLKEGSRITAERWEWRGEKWTRTVRIGEESLPCMLVMDVLDDLDDEMHLKLGDGIKLAGRSWRVVEVS